MKILKRLIKQWVWNWTWVQFEVKEAIKREEINYATRLFKNAVDDVQAGFEGDVKVEAKVMAEKMLVDLLSPIDPKHIVSIDKRGGLIYFGTDKADPAQLKNLQAEAAFLLESQIWRLIHETPKELAQKAMFVEGDSLDTLKKGRSMLYTLQTQKNIVDIFAGYKG